jgi:hypothetical protein
MDQEKEQRERAYRIWEDEGRPEGKHEEHWAQAALTVENQDGYSTGHGQEEPAAKPPRGRKKK